MLPVLVRYFSTKTGTQSKLIDMFELEDETGDTLFKSLKSVWEEFDIRPKIKAFSGDNAKENFGGITRGGDKNLFSRLQKEFDNQLVGIECTAHLAHKAIEKACHQFQPFFDIEAVVVNIYNYFKTSTVRNSRLKHLASDDMMKLLGYANTRFLAFRKCIDRIIENFDALEAFFQSEKNAPIALVRFFEHQLARLLLIFVRDQCRFFESAIGAMEGSHVSGYEASQIIFALSESIRERMNEGYNSVFFERELSRITELLPFTDTVLTKVGNRTQHTEIHVDEEYIEEMVQRFQSNFPNQQIFVHL